MLDTLEVSPMKLPDPWRTRGQVRLARVLIVVLLVAAPGLYGWTEYEPARPAGEAAELPRTPLRLTPLGPDAKQRMRRRLQLRINRADTRQLRRLPGVGPVLAKRIVRVRRREGPFPAVEALTRVTGIGPATVERLRPRARVSDTIQRSAARGTPGLRQRSQASPTPVRLNAADTDRLKDLPGIGPVLAGRILRRRRRNGPFDRLEDLRAVRGIGPVTVRRLEPRVRLKP